MSYQSRQRIAAQDVVFMTPASPQPSLGQRLALKLAVDARSLRDAGISPAAAAYESGKAFWQASGPLR